jgi:acetyl esterase/lipase
MMDRAAIFERLAAWGAAFTPDMMAGTQQLYAPLVQRPDEARVDRDLSYGDHERHRLDIFRPDRSDGGAPVLLFVHGGGFVMGDKGAAGAPFHNNIGAWASGLGLVGATMTYRLAPGHVWPSGGEDVARAAAWLRANVAQHGGDLGRIFIMGQSAGATHVADAVAAGAEVAGAIMISGIYCPQRAERNDFQRAYYGADQAKWGDCSALEGLSATDLPCFYGVAEYDPPDFQRQAAWLVEDHVAERERWPAMHWLKGHNHISSVSQIGSEHDTLGPLIHQFISATAGR